MCNQLKFYHIFRSQVNTKMALEKVEDIVAAISPYIGGGEMNDLLTEIVKRFGREENSQDGPMVMSSDDLLPISLSPEYREELDAKYPLTEVSSTEEVKNAVKQAAKAGKVIRTVGSAHSIDAAIYTHDSNTNTTLLLVGELRKIEHCGIDEDGFLKVRAGAGCYLGINPQDRAKNEEDRSKLENSFDYTVDSWGFALPILGGITQQTVGGFLSTGSAGGSLQHGFADVIEDIEFVDGTGKHRIAIKGSDEWKAIGVSMGLLGVITHIHFRLPPRFLVKGTEINTTFKHSSIGPKAPGKFSLKESLEENEYYKVYWFAQKFVNRVQTWKGKQNDRDPIDEYHNSLAQNPVLAHIGLRIIDGMLQQQNPCYLAIAAILWIFVPIYRSGNYQQFNDLWYKTLPSDEQIPVDGLMKVVFTELWFPIDKCDEVMSKLQELFEKDPKAAANTPVEIYGAKESPFWLSPSNDGAVVRIDGLWFAKNMGGDAAREKFYDNFYNTLLGVHGVRFHWGKYLPELNGVYGGVKYDHKLINKAYPHMEDWKKIRKQMDPKDVFVTQYWKKYLDL